MDSLNANTVDVSSNANTVSEDVDPSELSDQTDDDDNTLYLILFSDPKMFCAHINIEYVDRAKTWDEITAHFINLMNEICPAYISLHTHDNIKPRGGCYRFVYDDMNCGECDSLWCILVVT